MSNGDAIKQDFNRKWLNEERAQEVFEMLKALREKDLWNPARLDWMEHALASATRPKGEKDSGLNADDYKKLEHAIGEGERRLAGADKKENKIALPESIVAAIRTHAIEVPSQITDHPRQAFPVGAGVPDDPNDSPPAREAMAENSEIKKPLEDSPTPMTEQERENNFLNDVITKLTNYIPEENRPSLKRLSRIAGASKEAREQILLEQEARKLRAEADFDEPESKAGKALEIILAAFTVKNDDEAGGLQWAGRKSTSVLAHESQDYSGKTDLILIYQGAQESYAPSQTALRIDANTGYVSLIKKLRRNLDFLKMGHMGDLPFTTLPLGGGLDVQGANLENAPLALASFSKETVLELAHVVHDDSKWETLKGRPEQLMLLQQIELQMEAYR